MTVQKGVPNRLYKYRAFSSRLLDMLVDDKLYYANPSEFNDPLDCQATIDVTGANIETLENTLRSLINDRFNAEMSAAVKIIRISDQKDRIEIQQNSRKKTDKIIREIRYQAGNPQIKAADPHKFILKQHIEQELLQQYKNGVVSFSTLSKCPLMWSHYGDQHRGVCIGYSISKEMEENVHMVNYGGERNININDVAIQKIDTEASRRVDEGILLRKAKSWSYEHEWRLIGNRGLHPSNLEIEEVIFGIRCQPSVQYIISKSLQNHSRTLKFYEIFVKSGTFRLCKRHIDTSEIFSFLPKRSREHLEHFENLNDNTQP